MRVHEISELLQAFDGNRQLHRSHIKELLNSHFKKNVILPYWDKEVRFNQRVLFDLAKELDHIQWYDEEVWTKIFDTAVEKKKINNLHDFQLIHNLMHKLNSGGASDTPFKNMAGKFDTQMESLISKHFNENRNWKYDLETRDLRPI